MRARAIENQLHLVASGYDVPTAIYNRAFVMFGLAALAITLASAHPLIIAIRYPGSVTA